MKRTAVVCALLVMALGISTYGCGGGGGDSAPAPAPTPAGPEDIRGTYRLTGFTVIHRDGGTLTEKSAGVTSWSGSMEVGPTTIMQRMMLNGVPVSGTWTYSAEWVTSTTGFLHANTNSVKFTMSGGNLTTDYVGADYEEWDYWTKVSGSYTVKSPEKSEPEVGAYIGMADLL